MNGHQDMLTLREARRALGKHHATLKRMLADADIELFTDPADKRVLLIRRDDIARIATPRPISRRSGRAEPMPAV